MSRLLSFSLCAAACAPPGVVDPESAELAYLGLDPMVEKGMELGFDGFNAATNANIDPQTADGLLSGTLTVTGKVDQGSSDNKGMRLFVALDGYADVVARTPEDVAVPVIYGTTPGRLPALGLTLRNFPDGTLTGSLTGVFVMQGDLEGEVRLDLVLAGTIEADGAGGTRREVGSTTITGTATSPFGVYDVDVTR